MEAPCKPHADEGVTPFSAKVENAYLADAVNSQLMVMTAIGGTIASLFSWLLFWQEVVVAQVGYLRAFSCLFFDFFFPLLFFPVSLAYLSSLPPPGQFSFLSLEA